MSNKLQIIKCHGNEIVKTCGKLFFSVDAARAIVPMQYFSKTSNRNEYHSPKFGKKTFGQHSIGCTRKVESFRVQKIN